jgi:hypothetical protein
MKTKIETRHVVVVELSVEEAYYLKTLLQNSTDPFNDEDLNDEDLNDARYRRVGNSYPII